MLPGKEIGEIRDAITGSFTEAELTMAVDVLMSVNLDVIIGSGKGLQFRAFELVKWADRDGRVEELVQALAKSRPRSPALRVLADRYGLATPVSVAKAGAGVAGAPATAADVHGALEKIVNPFLSFSDFGIWRERMARTEGRVCMITVGGTAAGTGFLVGPDTVLTNYHVLEEFVKPNASAKPTDVECVFDFKKPSGGGPPTRTPVRLHADWNIDSSPYAPHEGGGGTTPGEGEPTLDQLDYALVRLADAVGNQDYAQQKGSQEMVRRGWVRVRDQAEVFKTPMGIIIAQHPAGFPLKLALDTAAVNQEAGLWLNGNGTRVRYAVNTLGGSSGSPVFDLEWNLIALHHYGDAKFGHKPNANQGVPIHLIRDQLTKNGKADALGGDPPG